MNSSRSNVAGINSSISGVSSDSLSSKNLPKTGYEKGLLVGIIVLSGIAIICYKKYKM